MIKDDILKVRLTKEEKQQIRYFSRRMGLNMSEYVKYCIMKNEALKVEISIDEKINY
ncbi:MAG: hypothetical protein E6415_14385 [Intestinibacter bartlettii]|uniref:plasmid mobilization protein n=1 Tax=Intestinibacter bartlettii TaxID=261299 RepID=UPI002902FBCB|nr:hypothetical protein [Intestinibacter bartlettii]MDU0937439.1 hypothetical protein [Dermabacter sp.]MDU1476634.1 hypothetical protein [Clostridium perfringens]MDU6824475.1 hypothetical protein [Intestinibacter bartlettii]